MGAGYDQLHIINCICCPCTLAETLVCDITAPCAMNCLGLGCTALTCDQACCVQKIDFAFPPCCTSVGHVNVVGWPSELALLSCPLSLLAHCFVDWKRAGKEDRESSVQLVKDGFNPNDIHQGAIGDCWLLSAMSSLAEHPEAVKPLIIEREVNRAGLYHVQVFDGPSQSWRVLSVDTLVPTIAPVECCCRTFGKQDQLIATASREGELWPAVLQKALAKHVGSYHALDGGQPSWALEALTGQRATRYENGGNGESWIEQYMSYPMGANRSEAYFRSAGRQLTGVGMHDELCKRTANGHVVCAGCVNNDLPPKGLVDWHAYSVLSARKVGEHRLVSLRNPWGSGSREWHGPWGDHQKEWSNHPEVWQALQHTVGVDGVFWMEWKDFAKRMKMISTVRPRPDLIPTPSLARARLEGRLGFMPRCALDLFSCLCLCGGVRHACVICGSVCGTCITGERSTPEASTEMARAGATGRV